MHQECIHLIERTATLSPTLPLYSYQDALLDFADSAREYNQAGLTSI